MMPELDGFSACREIRKFSSVPIIMLSARGEEYDKINGFDGGADDYVVKPFSPKELMLRIAAVMKRVRAAAPAEEEKPKNKPTSQENKKVEQVAKKEEQTKVEVMTLEKAKATTFEAKGKVYKVGECSNEQLFYLRDNVKDAELLDAVKLVLMDKAKTGNITDEQG
jgi:DNA-binding response OmpR family regulator